jgi:SAM-dependent methyltransferase
MTEQIEQSIYDFPVYYDLLFGSDWQAEFEFLEFCFERYTNRTVKRLFEPACGTGRLLIKLAKSGYDVGGNDLNPKAIAYCNDRLERHGFDRPTTVGDMSNFRVSKKFDAAFNTINSFRHLPTEAAAEAHLKCMSNALAKGGLYILGLHLLPTSGPTCGEEAWSARRGNLAVNSYMWSKKIDKRNRMEHLGMTIDIYTPTSRKQIVDHMEYRTYTKKQFEKLLSTVPEFEIAGLHDFAYETDYQIELNAKTEDAVFILRKR